MHAAPDVRRESLAGSFLLPGMAQLLPSLLALAPPTTASHPALQPLYDALVGPFRSDGEPGETTDAVEVTVATVGSQEAAMAASMLT